MLLIGCQKETAIDQIVLNSTTIILRTENILRKIPSSEEYKELKVKYSTNKKSIYLSYGHFDNNYYRIDTLQSIKYLTKNELSELKRNIYQLSNMGLSEQNYAVYDPNLRKGIYIYRYKYKDWMADELQMVPYIALAKNIDKNNQWFNNTFKIVTQKDSIVVLTKKAG